MKDIIERLDDCRAIDGSVSFVEINENVLTDAKAEITRLRNELIIAQCTRDEARRTIEQIRSVAGAVSLESGLMFSDLKRINATTTAVHPHGMHKGFGPDWVKSIG